MKTDFKSKLELVRYYSDEDNCKKLLAQQRWPNGVVCVHCGYGKVYETSRGYKCANKECYKKFSVISKTIFENTKIPLNKWFEAIFVLSAHKKGISSHQLAKDIDVSQKTAWFILHRVREMLKEKSPALLEGTIEIDETFIGGKEKNRHQSDAAKAKRKKVGGGTADKTAVLGLLQRDGKLINQVMQSTGTKDILPVIQKNVKPNSLMVTDEWISYRHLPTLGYKHETVSHLYKEYVRGIFHTNSIEGYWSQLKRGIYGVYHHVTPKHLNRYCDEFAFKYNHRKTTDVEKFVSILSYCSGRLTWGDLTKKP